MRRVAGAERCWLIGTALAVLSALVLSNPLHPLLQWTGSAGWSRLFEFVPCLIGAWQILYVLGLTHVKFEVGKEGFRIVRDAPDAERGIETREALLEEIRTARQDLNQERELLRAERAHLRVLEQSEARRAAVPPAGALRSMSSKRRKKKSSDDA